MDQAFFGRSQTREWDDLLKRFSQDDLVAFVENVEQYTLENLIYLMQYTFHSFDDSLSESYAAQKAVNKVFVQNVFDKLQDKVADTWVDFKENTSRLNKGLSDVYVRLSGANKDKLKSKFDLIRNKKLDLNSLSRLINIAVSYPIVLSTNYFVGHAGSGSMNLRVTWIHSGSDSTLSFSMDKPLKGYFRAAKHNLLQILDFGYLSFDPNEYERNEGLALAIKTGFFDKVNLALGKKNNGLYQNLALFYKYYVADNRTAAESIKSKLNEVRKIRHSHWKQILNMCQFPISSKRKFEYGDIDQSLYLDSKNLESGIIDLSYIAQMKTLRESATSLDDEIDALKRTYLVIKGALAETGQANEHFNEELRIELKPHLQAQKAIYVMADAQLQKIKANGNCLNTLTKMERFQQLLLQRKTVDYLAQVHAAMGILRSFSPKDFEAFNESGSAVDNAKRYLQDLSSKNNDPYVKRVVEKVVKSNVLALVSSGMGVTGVKLLQEALNLVLSVHNFNENFGYRISKMKTRATDFGEHFLGRRGGFTKKEFIINQFDQFMRVREDVLSLSSSVSQIKKYFLKTSQC